MRILLINQFYPPDVAATGQLLEDVALALVREGHEVHVVCSRSAYGGGSVHDEGWSARGVRVHRVRATGFGRARVVARLLDYASFYLLAGLRVLGLPRMDACVCLTTPPFIALLGGLLRRLHGTRLVLWTMDLYPEILSALGVLNPSGRPARLLASISRSLYRQADAVICLGDKMRERLLQAGARPERTHVVHNWAPGEVVQPIAPADTRLRRQWAVNGTPVVMYSGNLGAGHELDTLVRALAEMGQPAAVQAIFVGHGKMRPVLERMASELGLRSVRFLPPQPLADLGELLAAGDIHIVAQRPGTEGLIVPSKLYGILAAGRPAVFVGAPDCEAARILCLSQAGLVVAPGDVATLKDCLQRLAEDPVLRNRMGANARRYYLTRLGRDRSVQRIVAAVGGDAGTGSIHSNGRHEHNG